MTDDAARYRRSLWADVERHLKGAQHLVELAQGVLEDLGNSDYADQLQPTVDTLRQAANEAEEAAT